MKSSICILFASFIAIVAAADNPFKVNSDFSVTAGKQATIEWQPTTQGPVTLTLRSGASSDLNKGTPIASNIPNSGSYTFTLPEDTTRNSDYTIAISPVSDPSNMNYTPQFVVESKNTVASTTDSDSSMTAATISAATKTSMSGKSSMTTSASSKTSGSSSMSRSSSSMSSTGSSSAAATTAAAAPTNAAGANKAYMQGGVAAVLMGAAAML